MGSPTSDPQPLPLPTVSVARAIVLVCVTMWASFAEMDKHLILRENKQKYVAQERKILDTMDSESVAKLFFTFQDASALCEYLAHTLLQMLASPSGAVMHMFHRKALAVYSVTRQRVSLIWFK